MFDKHKCLANIRQLLQSSDVKIGQIEKAAKCQPGYLSRIEKPTNTAEPSITFVSTAAEMLNTSIDTLVYASIA